MASCKAIFTDKAKRDKNAPKAGLIRVHSPDRGLETFGNIRARNAYLAERSQMRQGYRISPTTQPSGAGLG